MATHLLPSDLLYAYAAGHCAPAMRLLISTQMQLCDETARRVEELEALGGALLERVEPTAMSEGALETVLARLDASPAETSGSTAANDDDVEAFPAPLREAAREALKTASWRFAGPGIRTLTLPVDGHAKAELLRIQPGSGAPRHGHKGAEITLVVRGAFRDETGVYGAGDVSVASPDVEHRPIAEPGETCYALAVTDAPLAFTGALGWIQRAVQA
ncbi:MAG: ChrR family anti-sigma-E factor [Pseudomonadota bacterium]